MVLRKLAGPPHKPIPGLLEILKSLLASLQMAFSWLHQNHPGGLDEVYQDNHCETRQGCCSFYTPGLLLFLQVGASARPAPALRLRGGTPLPEPCGLPLPELRGPTPPKLRGPPLPELRGPSLPELRGLPLPELGGPRLEDDKRGPTRRPRPGCSASLRRRHQSLRHSFQ